MLTASASSTRSEIEPLDWESRHFGLAAARLADADLNDAALARSLAAARAMRIDFLVWAAGEGRRPSAELLTKYHGKLVDRKATFGRSLDEITESDLLQDLAAYSITPYADSTASSELVELAVAAGAYSRFRIDERLAFDKFQEMYRIWIERSVKHELADLVLIAQRKDASESHRIGGMITVSVSEEVGNIGLLAVASAARGLGLGSALIAMAHRVMRKRGASQARVVTQLDNIPACRLYERAGYRLCRLQHFYHFWPTALV